MNTLSLICFGSISLLSNCFQVFLRGGRVVSPLRYESSSNPIAWRVHQNPGTRQKTCKMSARKMAGPLPAFRNAVVRNDNQMLTCQTPPQKKGGPSQNAARAAEESLQSPRPSGWPPSHVVCFQGSNRCWGCFLQGSDRGTHFRPCKTSQLPLQKVGSDVRPCEAGCLVTSI